MNTATSPRTAKSWREEVIERKTAEKGWEIIALEVMPDHVHWFVKHEPKAPASYVANQFKGFTSRVLREEFRHLKSRTPTLRSSPQSVRIGWRSTSSWLIATPRAVPGNRLGVVRMPVRMATGDPQARAEA